MPRYLIRAKDGAVVNRIIAPAEQVDALLAPGDTAEIEAADDFTPERLDRFAAAEARRFLDATDWYVIRALDPTSGAPIPAALAAARAEARRVAGLDAGGQGLAPLPSFLIPSVLSAPDPASDPTPEPALPETVDNVMLPDPDSTLTQT
jgi:hypothetical protein